MLRGEVLLNGKPLFMRLILDQGFYPDGVYTAPTEDALIHDIELAKSLGFNGARMHEKVFEERWLYHAAYFSGRMDTLDAASDMAAHWIDSDTFFGQYVQSILSEELKDHTRLSFPL